MIATLRNRRCPAVVFLVLCGAPLCAGAQQFVCWPIARGDTASELARRLTGTAETAYGDAFQIKDPARRLFVPKSRYSRLSTNWQACVVPEALKDSLRARTPAAPPRAVVAAPPPATAAAAAPPWPEFDTGFALFFGAGVSLMLLMISAVSGYAPARPIPPAVQRVGEEFVKAFATPLIDPTSAVPPIVARLKFSHRAKRLEIALAPHGGRRYPNLSDHRKNVEYDVNRVIRILGAYQLSCDRLRAQGPWVIVSIRLAHPKQAGAK